MWALVENNQVSKLIKSPKAINIGEVNYPANIFSLWSASELEAISIYSVVEDNSNRKDPSYYNNTEQTIVYSNGVVTASYGPAAAKDLDQLKTSHKKSIDEQAYGLLQSNDWLVVRNQEVGTAIPTDWTNFRADVRSTATDMKSKIDAATNVDELAALYEYNEADPQTRPLGEWPTPPSN